MNMDSGKNKEHIDGLNMISAKSEGGPRGIHSFFQRSEEKLNPRNLLGTYPERFHAHCRTHVEIMARIPTISMSRRALGGAIMGYSFGCLGEYVDWRLYSNSSQPERALHELGKMAGINKGHPRV